MAGIARQTDRQRGPSAKPAAMLPPRPPQPSHPTKAGHSTSPSRTKRSTTAPATSPAAVAQPAKPASAIVKHSSAQQQQQQQQQEEPETVGFDGPSDMFALIAAQGSPGVVHMPWEDATEMRPQETPMMMGKAMNRLAAAKRRSVAELLSSGAKHVRSDALSYDYSAEAARSCPWHL